MMAATCHPSSPDQPPTDGQFAQLLAEVPPDRLPALFLEIQRLAAIGLSLPLCSAAVH